MNQPAVIIYHNPRCSKSRQTLLLIEEKGISPSIVKYLETPPSIDELRDIVSKLGFTPRELLRTNEEPYKTLGLKNPDVTDEEILAAMAEHPKLIERPVVISGNKAVVGRPPENVLKLI